MGSADDCITLFSYLETRGFEKVQENKAVWLIPVSSAFLFQVSNSETYRKRARCKSECLFNDTVYKHSKYCTVHGKWATFILKKCTQIIITINTSN